MKLGREPRVGHSCVFTRLFRKMSKFLRNLDILNYFWFEPKVAFTLETFLYG